ncbi:MAG: hypothetical protein IKU25_09440 [Clostridia bacterium]|nr:hypothetical protein [Clostridia bacterium]
MSKFKDLTGKKFALLTVISRAESRSNGTPYWNCVCDCGGKAIVSGNNLKFGGVKSCGCLLHKKHDTHHLSGTKLYYIWRGMLVRCYDENSNAYKYYGARGISVCEKWKNDFLSFYNWSISNGYKEGLTIDRTNNGLGYSPENCRWVDCKVQANNRAFCKKIEYNGEIKTLMQWCEELNLNYKRVHSRLYRLGWSFEDAISIPVKTKKQNYGL